MTPSHLLPALAGAFSHAGLPRRGLGGQQRLGSHAVDVGICHHLNNGLLVRWVAPDGSVKLNDIATLLRGVDCVVHGVTSFFVVAPFSDVW